ncbi:MAG: membrane protein [Peptococcaceae bacterium BRH_c8a]|nr:MAG: membrane protein [Peptococcaceae bacterium BRH_c8a]
MSIRFFIYGLLGWGLEVAYTGLGSAMQGSPRLEGHTYLWMFPIYGLAVFLEPLHNAMRPLHWYLRGLVWVLVIWVLEYATGAVIRSLVGTSPWVYREGWQVNGLIRLDMAPLWFVVGLLFERLHDWLTEFELTQADDLKTK